MWPVILFGISVVAVIAALEYVFLPYFVAPLSGDPSLAGRDPRVRFRRHAFPVWLALTTGLGYAFFDRYEALSAHKSDGPVYATCLVAIAVYGFVRQHLSGKPHLTDMARLGAEIGLVLGTGFWVVLHW